MDAVTSVESLRVYRYAAVNNDYWNHSDFDSFMNAAANLAIFDFQWVANTGEPQGFRTVVKRGRGMNGDHTVRPTPFGALALVVIGSPDIRMYRCEFRAELRLPSGVYELPIIDGEKGAACADGPQPTHRCRNPDHWELR